MDDILLNSWYMAGWSSDLDSGRITRRVVNIPILLYRLESGDIAALEDRCPHRFAPLSRGDISRDAVTCAYHGLTFDQTGSCIRNPFSDKIPPAARVRSFPVVEADTIVWVWPGDRDQADPALIPDFSFLRETAQSHSVRGYTMMKANYQYGTDNLMDLSHIEFVHRGTFAGQGVIFAGQHNVVQDGATLHSNWWIPDIDPPSMATGVYPPGTKVDHWIDMRWNAPASMELTVGATPVGSGRDNGFIVQQAHILTPATAGTTHYFWATARHNDIDSKELDAMLLQLFGEAFDQEDKPIIEASYANTDGVDFWHRKPLSLGIDAGGTRARRLLEKMIREEQAPVLDKAMPA